MKGWPCRTLFAAAALFAAVAISACGSKGISVPKDDPGRAGAEIFSERCSSCHSLSAAGAEGSSGSEKTNGPDLDYRKVTKDAALYAIFNGGFGGNIMPANVVVGEQAEQVASFVARYSGKKVKDAK